MNRAKEIPLGIRDEFCSLCDHVAYFWEAEEEFKRGVQFLSEGLRAKDDAVVFGYEEANEKVLRVLQDQGVDVKQEMESGRLVTLSGEKTGDAILSKIGNHFQQRIEQGTKLIRLLGNIGWGRPNWPKEADILEFEARVTDAARQFPCVIVCMYDVRSLSGRVILSGAIETHPITIRGNVMRENPHYVAVQDFLDRLRAEAAGPRPAQPFSGINAPLAG